MAGRKRKYATEEEVKAAKRFRTLMWYHKKHPEAEYGKRGRKKTVSDEERKEKNRIYNREYKRKQRLDPAFYAKELEKQRIRNHKKAKLRPKRKKLSKAERRRRAKIAEKRWRQSERGKEICKRLAKQVYERNKLKPEWRKKRYEQQKIYRKRRREREKAERANRKV